MKLNHQPSSIYNVARMTKGARTTAMLVKAWGAEFCSYASKFQAGCNKPLHIFKQMDAQKSDTVQSGWNRGLVACKISCSNVHYTLQ
jgi:hypothetical protein